MSFKKITIPSHGLIKILAVISIFILGIGYVAFSYKETYETFFNKSKDLLSHREKKLTIAFRQYSQYMNLLESRLSHSVNSGETTTRILAERVEISMGDTFPKIINLEFFPATQKNLIYTRLGVTSTKVSKLKEGITYLGKGSFQSIKILRDEKKNAFGTLRSTFSVSHLLHKDFTQGEIHIFPENKKIIPGSQLTFKIKGLPYMFGVNQSPPTFLQFIFSAKAQILLVFALMVVVLLLGGAMGSYLNKKLLLKQRSLNKKLKENLKISDEKTLTISSQLADRESLLQYKDQATKLKDELFISLNERCRQMAAQAQSINVLTSKLILEEAGNDRLLKEIHSVSQEGTAVLRQLVEGFPMKEKVEEIDVFQSLTKIKSLFLPELAALNISFTIKGAIKTPLQTDQVTFDLAIYNIFRVIVERLSKNNMFEIEINDHDPFQVTFYDNGYDLEERVHKIKNTEKIGNILWLDKRRLKEYVNHLGWEISFQKGKQLLNSIKLSIPRTVKTTELPENVINLFDYKPYAQ